MFKKREILPILIIVLVAVLGFIFYPLLPEEVPNHWNARGEVDAYASKEFFVIFYSSLTLAVYLLMSLIPKIDPLKKNYLKFENVYFWTKVSLVVFFSLMYVFTLFFSLGKISLNINFFIIPLISLLYIILGMFLPKIKRNYFFGIKTPWTLNSEEVWDKTHAFSGKLFIVFGLISLSGILFKNNASALVFLISILIAALGSVLYSYIIFRKLDKDGNN